MWGFMFLHHMVTNMVAKTKLREVANRTIESRRLTAARLVIALGAFVAGSGVTAATQGPAAAPVLPLAICSVPGLGDFAAWLLPNLRELAIYGGAVSALYGVIAAPVEGGRMSPRQWIILGIGAFTVGVLWVALVTYLGTDILGGNEAIINAATCGINTGA